RSSAQSPYQYAPVSSQQANDFNEFIQWLKSAGWASYLQTALGINLFLEGEELKKELLKELNADRLAALRQDAKSGYDDFAGERLLQPGFPAYSLLFHSMASPRVRPAEIKEYPTLQQIDTLENYIYAICEWEQLKSIYNIDSLDNLVFAIFAYEYRPAFKTPHHAHADLVYSRTGIARIGSEPHNYDRVNRCYIDRPADPAKEKTAAVIPARYGLFIARKVKNDNISLVKSASHKGKDSKDDRYDNNKVFLQPIRKVFENDTLVKNFSNTQFAETHKTEKLLKLANSKGIEMLNNRKPKAKDSKDLIIQDDQARRAGSSFLVISQPAALIRPAKEDGRVLFFKVPRRVLKPYDNRFFNAFCTQEVEDVELLDNNLERYYNRYDAPRNQPMFVNITIRGNGKDDRYDTIPKTPNQGYENVVDAGKYWAPLFEDSICDGKVFISNTNLLLEEKKLAHLPAFSIVTAPDFFPQVDPLDLLAYDNAPGISKESSFYEGGVASLATARIMPNPKMIETTQEVTKDTYLAVLSHMVKQQNRIPPGKLDIYKNPAEERGYEISSFLPDVASSVFAPGWDVTYCRRDKKEDIYIGTEGLGSPFVEDMKFCAALNGMWPATSPDNARTYQGSNEPDYRNPTAIPLLDVELGICGRGPAGNANENWGWDGEQGPYLENAGTGKWKINFTDLGRSNAVHNTLNGKIDLSQLRKLKSAELIARMECLKLCISVLPMKNFRKSFTRKVTAFTYLWLVSAEKVNWGNEDARALNVPINLAGSDKKWITDKANAKVKGPGYLYLFANSETDKDPKDWMPDLKRRRLLCREIYICQVTNDPASPAKVAWAQIPTSGDLQWHAV
ncbi:MAG TPA: hypothetical protein VFZ47_13415, partial [Chitinophagaceae bacterium]